MLISGSNKKHIQYEMKKRKVFRYTNGNEISV
jgi:hypothetical protein